jgi:hypothetical protein
LFLLNENRRTAVGEAIRSFIVLELRDDRTGIVRTEIRKQHGIVGSAQAGGGKESAGEYEKQRKAANQQTIGSVLSAPDIPHLLRELSERRRETIQMPPVRVP